VSWFVPPEGQQGQAQGQGVGVAIAASRPGKTIILTTGISLTEIKVPGSISLKNTFRL